MNQSNQNKSHDDVQQVLKDVLQRMNIKASVEQAEFLGTPYFSIHSDDNNLLIGENGQHLYALQTIVKRVFERKHTEPHLPFLIDVNDYQRHHIEDTKERARMGAQRVRYFKKEVVMQPMNSYERRIIHMVLSEDPDVVTESMGEGENRRVVIRPVNL